MFLKTKTLHNKTYLSFVESYREEGKIKQRTVSTLGCVENFKPGQLLALAEKLKLLENPQSKPKKNSYVLDESTISEMENLNWGAPKIIRHLWNLFALDSLIDRCSASSKIQFDVKEAIFSIILNRFVAPASKLQVFEQQNQYVGIKNMSLQHFYRSLDFLCEHKEKLEKEIFDKNRTLFNMQVDVVFYDVTTLYFESSRPNELKDFGYSKDCKFNEVQIVLGLLIDADGRPVGYDVYPGNTFEGKTLEHALLKLKERFKVARVIIVADRGINSKMNLKSIRDAGYHYIVGCRLRKMPKHFRKEALDEGSYKVIHDTSFKEENAENANVVKIKTLDYVNSIDISSSEDDQKHKTKKTTIHLDEKIILTWSSKRAAKDQRDRERLVKKAIAIVNKPSIMNESRGAKKYIKQNRGESIRLRADKISEDAKWDGFYGITTSNLEMPEEDIVAAYKNLWRIEESFRILKFSLKTRPIFHWNAKRIKGHLMSCFLSFLLERTLELELRRHNIVYSVDKIRSAMRSLTLTPVTAQDQELYLRAKVEGLAKDIFCILGIKIPAILTSKTEFAV